MDQLQRIMLENIAIWQNFKGIFNTLCKIKPVKQYNNINIIDSLALNIKLELSFIIIKNEVHPWFIVEDVNRFKADDDGSQSSKQNGDACQKTKTGQHAVVRSPLSQESQQLTENDGIPEEVSDRKNCLLFHKA